MASENGERPAQTDYTWFAGCLRRVWIWIQMIKFQVLKLDIIGRNERTATMTGIRSHPESISCHNLRPLACMSESNLTLVSAVRVFLTGLERNASIDDSFGQTNSPL
jgi:hypothetical protein